VQGKDKPEISEIMNIKVSTAVSYIIQGLSRDEHLVYDAKKLRALTDGVLLRSEQMEQLARLYARSVVNVTG